MVDELNQTHWQPAEFHETVMGYLNTVGIDDNSVTPTLKALRLILWSVDYFDIAQIAPRVGCEMRQGLLGVISSLTDQLAGIVSREQVLIGMQAAGCLVNLYGRPSNSHRESLIQDWIDHLAILIKRIEIASIQQRVLLRGNEFQNLVSKSESTRGTLQ